MEYKIYNNLKIPQNLTPEQQAIVDEIAKKHIARDKEINADNLKNMGRIVGGSILSGLSAHPVLNIPYIGTGLGGAMYDAGQAIVEGDKLGDIAKRAGRGFAIGETVGALPYVGKAASKTKAGQAVGKQFDKVAEKVAANPAVQKAYDALMTEIQPLKEIERFKAKQVYNKLGTEAPNFKIFYKDSSLIDETGKPIKLFHGTPRGEFDAFDLAKSGESNSNEAKLGVWFGDIPNIANNFAKNAWWGNKPKVYETYVNLKNPKIYETGNYSELYDNLIKNKELQEQKLIDDFAQFADSYYRDGNLSNNSTVREGILKNLRDLNKSVEYYNSPDYKYYNGSIENPLLDYQIQRKLNGFEYLDGNKKKEIVDYLSKNPEIFKNIDNLTDEIDYLPSDSYDKFLNDIDKYNTRRKHGMREHFGANSEDIQNFKNDLVNQGYDGIIIKNTTMDAAESGVPSLNQYVVFNPKQIKSVDNSGLFDSSVNSLYDKAPKYYNQPTLKDIYNKFINSGTYAGAITNPKN